MKNKGIGGHQSANMRTDEWLTPPELIAKLGEFDLDPASPIERPWPTAKHHFTLRDNGLIQKWFGRVWLNPPYGRNMGAWLDLMARHSNGIALTFGRTDTEDFHRWVFPHADSIFFMEGRLHFYTVAGTRAQHNGGAPSVLLSYGEENVQAVADSGLKGRLLPLNSIPVVVVGISPSWKCVINIALGRLNGEAAVEQVYKMVELIAPDKVQKNPYYKEKVRQKLQTAFTRVRRGFYKQN
jgi:hypothetical protein